MQNKRNLQEKIRSTYASLLRKIVRGGCERNVDENYGETYQLVLSNRKILYVEYEELSAF